MKIRTLESERNIITLGDYQPPIIPPNTVHNGLKRGKKCNFGTTHCLPQRLKSTFFERGLQVQSDEKISKNVGF